MRGGAPDQLVGGAGATYRAASVIGLLHAIDAVASALPAARANALAASRTVPTMDDHFRTLMALYGQLTGSLAEVA